MASSYSLMTILIWTVWLKFGALFRTFIKILVKKIPGLGSDFADDICFVVNCDWSGPTMLLSNDRQTSVRWSHSKILSSLPLPGGIQAALSKTVVIAGKLSEDGENASVGCSCCGIGTLFRTCKSLLPGGLLGWWWVWPRRFWPKC